MENNNKGTDESQEGGGGVINICVSEGEKKVMKKWESFKHAGGRDQSEVLTW